MANSNHLCHRCFQSCDCDGLHLMTDCTGCSKCRPVPITSQMHRGTDELCVEFYECEACGFERIPKQQDNEYARACSDRATVTAKFCPGCGRRVEWL